MAIPNQLFIYNDALGHIGERDLASLTENREPRYVLDGRYAAVLDECLESGFWKHARRTVPLPGTDITGDGDFTAEFGPDFSNTSGFEYAYHVPDDCLQFYLLTASQDGPPMNDYKFENGYILSHVGTIYMTYISNDSTYGLNFDLWSPLFSRWVGCALAERVCYRITQSETMVATIEKRARRYKGAALSRDAMEGPTRRLPEGSWVASRRGGSSGPTDRQAF